MHLLHHCQGPGCEELLAQPRPRGALVNWCSPACWRAWSAAGQPRREPTRVPGPPPAKVIGYHAERWERMRQKQLCARCGERGHKAEKCNKVSGGRAA